MKWKLITTSVCPKCPEAKEWAEKNLDDYELLVADKNPDAMKLAMELNIKFVPAFVDEDNNEFNLNEMRGM